MSSTDVGLPAWLDSLLAERRQLRALIQKRFRSTVLAAPDQKVTNAIETELVNFVLKPLEHKLTPRTRPNPYQLAGAIIALPSVLNSEKHFENPAAAFNGMLGDYAPSNPDIIDRLLELAAPLDFVISKRLG